LTQPPTQPDLSDLRHRLRHTISDRATRWILWTVVCMVAAVSDFSIYRNWVGPNTHPQDFMVLFRAGKSVSDGRSPYVVHQFVYPPLLSVLVAPFSHLPASAVAHCWGIAALSAFTIAAVLVALQVHRDLSAWQTPLVVIGALLSAYHFWPLDYELSLGESDLIVLAVVACAGLALTNGRHRWSGVLIGIGASLKAWPAAIALELWRDRHRRALALTIATVALVPVLALAVGGWASLSGMFSALLRLRPGPPHIPNYCVWAVPRFLFSVTPFAHPVLVSNVLIFLAMALLAVWVIALLAITLVRHGPDEPLAFWNFVGCIVLLLPLSEFVYVLYLLPVLWLWGAKALSSRRAIHIAVFGLLLLWWHLSGQTWNVALDRLTPAWRMTAPFFLNLAGVMVSVIGLEFDRAKVASRPRPSGRAGRSQLCWWTIERLPVARPITCWPDRRPNSTR